MTDVWRILVVEADESLNRNMVNTLRKDGYVVRSAVNGADAVRALWSEAFAVVVCDLQTPGTGGFELLQWLRAYRPGTHMVLLGEAAQRVQALENGAAGYLERPLEMHTLKDELRRLLQLPGFSADLDSFDLLDVIQMITMNHHSIALLVNTGLEERGLLRFQKGDLIWAEYGTLRGEEAFFALAAHKNGSVTQQPWNDQVAPNVKQPLSRLIFQAVQYRTKYANAVQHSSEYEIDTFMPVAKDEVEVDDSPFGMMSSDGVDDTPFVVQPSTSLSPVQPSAAFPPIQPSAALPPVQQVRSQEPRQESSIREWWQRTSDMPRLNEHGRPAATDGNSVTSGSLGAIKPAPVQKAPAEEKPMELPSWLIDQPTTDMPVITRQMAPMPATPTTGSSPSEWQPSNRSTDPLHTRETPPPYDSASPEVFQMSPAIWQPPERQEPVQDKMAVEEPRKHATGSLPLSPQQYNYPALVSALQTLGYAISGFIAAAIVGYDGQSVAQVAVDDMDVSPLCRPATTILQSVLRLLECGEWGQLEDTVITSSDHRFLMRPIGEGGDVFQVLITSHEADLVESLNVMTNVEGAISAALE